MADKILFAGPFIGEFGIELFMWQGHIRKLSENFDKTIISSRFANKFIYEDFCDEFIPFEPKSYDCDGYECIDGEEIPNIHEGYNPDLLIRTLTHESYLSNVKNMEQKFFSYRKDKKYDIDVCVCARNFTRGAYTKISRNWDYANSKVFVDYLLKIGMKVASVGLKCSARYIEGTVDMMDIPLNMLSEVLSSSKKIIGPSSGVMHFASLCQCPQLVWGESHLRNRYEKEWNYFNTEVDFINKDNYDITKEEIVNLL